MSEKSRHLALLIRAQENEDGSRWRAMVEHVYTGEKIRFSERSGLLEYLQAHFCGESETQHGFADKENRIDRAGHE